MDPETDNIFTIQQIMYACLYPRLSMFSFNAWALHMLLAARHVHPYINDLARITKKY